MARKSKRQGIGFFSKLVLAGNVLAVITLLISYLASYINPDQFWIPAFFGLAYPVILILNILCIVYWLIRSPRYALLSAVTILLGWSTLTRYVGFRGESAVMATPKSSENFIRVMTFNAHSFKKFGDKNDRFTKEQILDIIQKEQPDILCFQEFFTRKKGDYDFLKLVKEILHTEEYYYKPSIDNGYESMGLAIFSKIPIKNRGNIKFTEKMNWNEAIFVDIQAKNNIFRVYNVHFQSISFQAEDYRYLREVTANMSTDVKSPRKIGTRLKRAFVKRGSQVQILREHADSCVTPYIIAGDFNDTPISYTVQTISKNLQNSFQKMGSGIGVTYNGEFPNFQIDYILVSQSFNVKNYLIINKRLSDHYPVRTDLELK